MSLSHVTSRPTVDRVEVIDQTGRVYVDHGVSHVEIHFQDEGRTMKIFLKSGD